MLSRVADNIYWMARYVERAENIARLLDVNKKLILDAPSDQPASWAPLIAIMAEEKRFAERYGEPTSDNVHQFLVLDAENPNSIASCLRFARENARITREVIPSDLWTHLNALFLDTREAAAAGVACCTDEFFRRIRIDAVLFFGIMNDIMSHGEAYHFAQLGRYIERADKTSRVIDVQYFMLLPRRGPQDQAHEGIQWMSVLKSVSAYEMYRKKWGGIDPRHVVEFLLLDEHFPRSVKHCVWNASRALARIQSELPASVSSTAEDTMFRVQAKLAETTINRILDAGLHQFIDSVQGDLNDLDLALYRTFFSPTPISA